MRWPHWTALRLWQNPYYTRILSRDYSPRIMFWWSDSSKTKGAALIIRHFFFWQRKKEKEKTKLDQTSFIIGFFFFNKKQQLSLWLQSLYQPDIEVFFVRLTAAFPEMPSFFPCSNNVLMDTGWMSVGGSSERNQRVGAGLDFVHSSWRSGWSMRGSAVSYREHIYSCFKERFVSLNLLALSVSASARRAGTATT